MRKKIWTLGMYLNAVVAVILALYHDPMCIFSFSMAVLCFTIIPLSTEE